MVVRLSCRVCGVLSMLCGLVPHPAEVHHVEGHMMARGGHSYRSGVHAGDG